MLCLVPESSKKLKISWLVGGRAEIPDQNQDFITSGYGAFSLCSKT